MGVDGGGTGGDGVGVILKKVVVLSRAFLDPRLRDCVTIQK